jgi:hypothetical protein
LPRLIRRVSHGIAERFLFNIPPEANTAYCTRPLSASTFNFANLSTLRVFHGLALQGFTGDQGFLLRWFTLGQGVGSHLILSYRGGDDPAAYERMKADVLEALQQHFRPEFLNRVDETVVFHSLSRAHLKRIVDIQLRHLRALSRAAHLSRTDRARANIWPPPGTTRATGLVPSIVCRSGRSKPRSGASCRPEAPGRMTTLFAVTRRENLACRLTAICPSRFWNSCNFSRSRCGGVPRSSTYRPPALSPRSDERLVESAQLGHNLRRHEDNFCSRRPPWYSVRRRWHLTMQPFHRAG